VEIKLIFIYIFHLHFSLIPSSATMSSPASVASSIKPVRKVRKWVTRNQGVSPNQISPLVRCSGEPAPYSVLDGVPIGSAVMSMTPEEYTAFIQEQCEWYSEDDIRALSAKTFGK
jgi:hypothetical protein